MFVIISLHRQPRRRRSPHTRSRFASKIVTGTFTDLRGVTAERAETTCVRPTGHNVIVIFIAEATDRRHRVVVETYHRGGGGGSVKTWRRPNWPRDVFYYDTESPRVRTRYYPPIALRSYEGIT